MAAALDNIRFAVEGGAHAATHTGLRLPPVKNRSPSRISPSASSARFVPVALCREPTARGDCGEDFLLFLFDGHLLLSLADDRNVLDSLDGVKGVMYIIPNYFDLERPYVCIRQDKDQFGGAV